MYHTTTLSKINRTNYLWEQNFVFNEILICYYVSIIDLLTMTVQYTIFFDNLINIVKFQLKEINSTKWVDIKAGICLYYYTISMSASAYTIIQYLCRRLPILLHNIQLSWSDPRTIIHAGILSIYLFLYCHRRSNYQEGEDWDSNNRFNPTSFLCLPKTGSGFPKSYVVIFSMFIDLRREVVVLLILVELLNITV